MAIICKNRCKTLHFHAKLAKGAKKFYENNARCTVCGCYIPQNQLKPGNHCPCCGVKVRLNSHDYGPSKLKPYSITYPLRETLVASIEAAKTHTLDQFTPQA